MRAVDFIVTNREAWEESDEMGFERAAVDFSEWEIRDARNRFYPGCWTYAEPLALNHMPLYRVICHDLEECDLARQAQPDWIRVEFVYKLAPKKQKRLEKLMAKSSNGTLSRTEEAALRRLVREAEELALANARVLATDRRQLAAA